jgi:hypothetical protein
VSASNHLLANEIADCDREKTPGVLSLNRNPPEAIENICRANTATSINEVAPGAAKNVTGTGARPVNREAQMSPAAWAVGLVSMDGSDDWQAG